MSDLSDLPLFSGQPAVEPGPHKPRPRSRCGLVAELIRADDEAVPSVVCSASVYPFPASRDVRLVAELAQLFITLRDRHCRRSRAMLLDRRFRPIGTRLRRMGVPAAAIHAELAQLEKAVARVVWIYDGRPAYGAGGGSSA